MTTEERIAQLEAERERLLAVIEDQAKALARMLPNGMELPSPQPINSPRIRVKTPEERAEAEQKNLERQRKQKEWLLELHAQKLAMREARKGGGRVYFVQQDGGENLVKIGHTHRDPEQRRKELQANQGTMLVVRASAPGGRSAENGLHHRFASLWVSGEWFRPGPDLLAYISLVAARGVL